MFDLAVVLLCSCHGSSGFSGSGQSFSRQTSNTAKRPLCPKTAEERIADSSRERSFMLRLPRKTRRQKWEKATGDNLDRVALSPWRWLFEELHWFFQFDSVPARYFTPPALLHETVWSYKKEMGYFLMTYHHVWPTQTPRHADIAMGDCSLNAVVEPRAVFFPSSPQICSENFSSFSFVFWTES